MAGLGDDPIDVQVAQNPATGVADVWPPAEWGYSAPPAMAPGFGMPASMVDAATSSLQQQPPMPAPMPDPNAPPIAGAAGFGPIPESAIHVPQAPPMPASPDDAQLRAFGPSAGPGGPGVGVPAAPTMLPAPKAPPLAQEGTAARTAIGPGGEQLPTDEVTIAPKPSDEEIRRQGMALADDPERLAATEVQRAQADELRAATAQRQDALSQLQKATDDHEAYTRSIAVAQAAQAQLVATAQDIANQKPNAGGWWDSRSGGQKIAAVISAIAGGFAAPSMGGKNVGLDMINKQIDRWVDDQKETLGNERAILGLRQTQVGQMFDQAGAQYHAQEAFRLAAHEQVIRQLQADQQLYDPAGTTAIRIGQTIGSMRAQQQALVMKYGSEAQKGALEQAKFEQLKKKEALDAAAKQRELDLRGYEISQQAENRKAQLAMHADEMEQKRLDRQQAIADKKADKEGEGVIGGVPQGVDERGNVTYGTLTQQDGTPLVIKDKDKHAKLTKMIGAADEVNRLSNQLAREIADWGGQSDTVKGAKWQKIKSDQEALVFALHSAEGIEGFRPGTAEMLEKLTGNVDPTAFIRTATPGIVRARDNVNEMVDTQLRRQANYTGAKYAPADTSALPPPSVSEVGQTGKDIAGSTKGIQNDPRLNMRDPDDVVYNEIQQVGGIKGTLADRYIRGEDENDQIEGFRKIYGDRFTPVVEHALRVGLAPSQMKDFDVLENTLTSRDPKVTDTMRQEAAAQLGELATKGPTQAISAYAAQLLNKTSMEGIPVPKGNE